MVRVERKSNRSLVVFLKYSYIPQESTLDHV